MSKGNYKGKTIESYSKAELIDIITDMHQANVQMTQRHAKDLDNIS